MLKKILIISFISLKLNSMETVSKTANGTKLEYEIIVKFLKHLKLVSKKESVKKAISIYTFFSGLSGIITFLAIAELHPDDACEVIVATFFGTISALFYFLKYKNDNKYKKYLNDPKYKKSEEYIKTLHKNKVINSLKIQSNL